MTEAEAALWRRLRHHLNRPRTRADRETQLWTLRSRLAGRRAVLWLMRAIAWI